MTKIIKLKTGSPFEDQASYSRLVVVDNWIYVSNTAGRNPQTKLIPEDILEQTHQVFANIETALAAVDASLADVVCSRGVHPGPQGRSGGHGPDRREVSRVSIRPVP
jgi:enamine deaminase RidA (YjgF/YER057c/UK114 family)